MLHLKISQNLTTAIKTLKIKPAIGQQYYPPGLDFVPLYAGRRLCVGSAVVVALTSRV